MALSDFARVQSWCRTGEEWDGLAGGDEFKQLARQAAEKEQREGEAAKKAREAREIREGQSRALARAIMGAGYRVGVPQFQIGDRKPTMGRQEGPQGKTEIGWYVTRW